MATAKVKEGNVKLSISVNAEVDNIIRKHYRKHGDYGKVIEKAVRFWEENAPENKITQA